MLSRPFSSCVYGQEEKLGRLIGDLKQKIVEQSSSSFRSSTSDSSAPSCKPSTASAQDINMSHSAFAEKSTEESSLSTSSYFSDPSQSVLTCKPATVHSTKRDEKESSIPYAVDKDCRCGKKCLQQLKNCNIIFIFILSSMSLCA